MLKRVLVIDDDLFFAVKIESALKKMGYEAKVCGRGELALEYANTTEIALAIINFGREKLSPLSLSSQLKQLPNPAPILGFISHGKIPEMRPLAKASGCDLLIANSVVALKLPQMIAKLAPLDGSTQDIDSAEEMGREGEVEAHS